MSSIVQALLRGVTNGGLIAVGAIGLTLLYGITGFINFAYGEYLTYSAFIVVLFTSIGLGLPLSAFIAIILIALLSVTLGRIFIDPLSERGLLPLLITTIGISFILRNLLAGLAGTETKQFPVPFNQTIKISQLQILPADLVVLTVSLISLLFVHILLQYTLLGKKMRATSGNDELARISGIDTDRVIRRTRVLAGAIAATAGILMGIRYPPFDTHLGWEFLIVIFSATILGGVGRPYGAMLGSLIVGIAMSLGTTFIASNYAYTYAFIILIGVLLIRPEGIIGGITDVV